jgi:hypothetical protein
MGVDDTLCGEADQEDDVPITPRRIRRRIVADEDNDEDECAKRNSNKRTTRQTAEDEVESSSDESFHNGGEAATPRRRRNRVIITPSSSSSDDISQVVTPRRRNRVIHTPPSSSSEESSHNDEAGTVPCPFCSFANPRNAQMCGICQHNLQEAATVDQTMDLEGLAGGRRSKTHRMTSRKTGESKEGDDDDDDGFLECTQTLNAEERVALGFKQVQNKQTQDDIFEAFNFCFVWKLTHTPSVFLTANAWSLESTRHNYAAYST